MDRRATLGGFVVLLGGALVAFWSISARDSNPPEFCRQAAVFDISRWDNVSPEQRRGALGRMAELSTGDRRDDLLLLAANQSEAPGEAVRAAARRVGILIERSCGLNLPGVRP